MNQDEAKAELINHGQYAALHLSGSWRLRDGVPHFDPIRDKLAEADYPKSVVIMTDKLKAWDSGLLVFLIELNDLCEGKGMQLDTKSLPTGVCKLLELARAAPEAHPVDKVSNPTILEQIGDSYLKLCQDGKSAIKFIGDTVVGIGNIVLGHGSTKRTDFMLIIEEAGVRALPIVGLISFLTGMILAFVGSLQLQAFGAEIYVADLVGITMFREMGAIMVGVVMAGRTSAAFAAQLGSMKVNEEIDALRTLGISPMEYLVVPRVVALIIMMPILVTYADFIGVIGGWIVSCSLSNVTTMQYYTQTVQALSINGYMVGVTKGAVFGMLVAGCGCLRGMQCEGSAHAVGKAATSAVVTTITTIIIADALFAIICEILHV